MGDSSKTPSPRLERQLWTWIYPEESEPWSSTAGAHGWGYVVRPDPATGKKCDLWWNWQMVLFVWVFFCLLAGVLFVLASWLFCLVEFLFVVEFGLFFWWWWFGFPPHKMERRLCFHWIPAGLDHALHWAEQGHSWGGFEDTCATQSLSLWLHPALSFTCSSGSRSWACWTGRGSSICCFWARKHVCRISAARWLPRALRTWPQRSTSHGDHKLQSVVNTSVIPN